MFITTMTIN